MKIIKYFLSFMTVVLLITRECGKDVRDVRPNSALKGKNVGDHSGSEAQQITCCTRFSAI